MKAKADNTLTLAGGRSLGYGLYGDPDGMPLIYCHGFPGSRLEAKLAHQEACRQAIKIIAVERPGYGLSEPAPTLLDLAQWARSDMAQLLAHLKLERFALMAVSGGAPAALALAHAFAGRVTGLTLVCPLPPLTDPAFQALLSPAKRLALRLALAAKGAIAPLVGLVAQHPRLVLRIFRLLAGRSDREVLARSELQEVISLSLEQALWRGGAGCSWDMRAYSSPLPFPLTSCATPTTLFHGEEDNIVPPLASHFYQQQLPHCRKAHFLSDAGHFSLPLYRMAMILTAVRETRGTEG
ncbi:MAG: alpha/beta hydrolase [Thermodesulfobacteriota bacterium]